ncbi:MAG: RNA 2',3'-cyclic phosphodiesterase [Candidatus Omnitrophota bacterium]
MNTTEKAPKIRSFIALELSDEARDEFSRIIGVLKEANADVKWLKPENIHLTLKFLGYVPEERIAGIAERLKKIASGAAPFEIVLGGIGVFPAWDYVKVLWVGAAEGADKAKDLAAQVEEAMAEEGFEKEARSFSPHFTLGRVRKAKNKDELKRLADSIKVEPASSHISRIVLFKSVLSPKGAEYTPLATANLAG